MDWPMKHSLAKKPARAWGETGSRGKQGRVGEGVGEGVQDNSGSKEQEDRGGSEENEGLVEMAKQTGVWVSAVPGSQQGGGVQHGAPPHPVKP
jgi:hypothetical protein